MDAFSLNHLDETQFEEFCYDLLVSMGAVNTKWRKGTGLSSSPADRGRDIECEFEHRDIDGTVTLQKWFVECKHYEKGVPPDKIQGALTWAMSERPHKLLIVASNFLSNPTKDFIENYKRNNAPPFEIKVWERPELERLTVAKSKLLRKYKIGADFPHLAIMHPAHILFSKDAPANTLDYFFKLLDGLDTEKRDSILFGQYLILIRPRLRKSVTGKETIKELMMDDISYDAFKKKCRELVAMIDEHFLVFSIVAHLLQHLLVMGDTTAIDEKLEFNKSMIKSFEEKKKAEGEDIETLESCIKETQEVIRTLPERIKESYDRYQYFCERVVLQLLLEKIKPLEI
jgi:Restriction endonuclease